MDLGIAGKAFIVVGGSRGMGRAAGEALAADGAGLAIVPRGLEGVEKAAAEIEATHGVAVIGLAADAGRELDLENAVAAAVSHFGRVDGFATTAGPIGTRVPFVEL